MSIDRSRLVGLERDIEDADALALKALSDVWRIRRSPEVDADKLREAEGWMRATLAEARRCRALKEAQS
jgi:hypothetical protein